MGLCRLCLKEKKLLKKSHIIPDFLFKDFKENNYFINMKYPEVNKVKRFYTGYYDKDILCQQCDNEIIGKLETYTSKAFYHKNKHENQISKAKTFDGLELQIYANIDYKKFKLFLLSILWRASISTHEMFIDIQLGIHEEKLRKMIYEDNPLSEKEFEICILEVNSNVELNLNFITNPLNIINKENKLFCFYIKGRFYFISVEINSSIDYYKAISIKESNKIEIPIIEMNYAKKIFEKIWGISYI